MSLEIRAIGTDEVDDLLLADFRAFGQSAGRPDESRSWAEGELDRTRVAFEDGSVVGVSRAYSFELTLPGGALVPVAAVSWVGVLPTHRRRGILTQMIRAIHDDARARNEPAAILTASESAIYGRFGYGTATWRLGLSVERDRAQFARPVDDAGRCRLMTREEAEKVLPSVYDEARRKRAGMVPRPDYWWPQVFWGLDGPDTAFFVVVHEDAHGEADGFAGYEISGEWSRGHSERKMMIWDLQATDARVRAALWEYLLGVDLVRTVEATNVPVDDPLRNWITDFRRVRVDFLNDGLWIAPLDAGALLAARRYSEFDARLVIEVVDPEGRSTVLAVEGNRDDGQCEVTTAAPDLVCSTRVLGACLLGGNRWNDFAQAGLVEERVPGRVAYADAMFATPQAPACTTGF